MTVARPADTAARRVKRVTIIVMGVVRRDDDARWKTSRPASSDFELFKRSVGRPKMID